jgi:hypothetical protein
MLAPDRTKLDRFLNPTVKLVGTIGSQAQEMVFKPESVSLVPATCEKSKQ